MFWGLIIEPNKRYTQTVEKPFHVSMATLDVSTADDDIVQVMLCYDNRNYLLCNLKKGYVWQVPLDLNFQEGTKIAFTSNGRGHVHLTGYLVPEDEMDDLDEFDEEDDEEEEEDEEIPQLVGKRKAKNSPKEGKAAKRLKESAKEVAEEEEDEEDDSSDDDGLLDGLMADEDSEDDDDEEGDAEDEDDDDDDDESDEEEEEEEEEEEVEVVVKPQKKGKQNKSQQQDQSVKQQKKKQEKSQQEQKPAALVNGKDKKAEKKGKDVANDSQVQKKRTISGGVQVEDLKMGNGVPAKAGKFVSVYYIGRLSNGKKFDASMQGDGFKFRLGKGEVIKGWDVGVQGMKVGGKRRLTIPAHMAYGPKGSPPTIPGNSTLVFEIELKQVH